MCPPQWTEWTQFHAVSWEALLFMWQGLGTSTQAHPVSTRCLDFLQKHAPKHVLLHRLVGQSHLSRLPYHNQKPPTMTQITSQTAGLHHPLDEAMWLFPIHCIIQCRLLISKCILPTTLSSYAVGLMCFTKFCDDYNIPEAKHMPASQSILSMFITVCSAGSVGNSAMKMWLEGINLWHTINDAPWHSACLFQCTLKVCPRYNSLPPILN